MKSNTHSLDDLVQRAVARNELRDLVLERPPYRYRSRFSPAPTDSDITELLSALYRLAREHPEMGIGQRLMPVLLELADRYEGILPVASVMLFESPRQAQDRHPLGLDLAALAARLRVTIARHRQRLSRDYTDGCDWRSGGKLGEVCRISALVQQDGGPSLCGE